MWTAKSTVCASKMSPLIIQLRHDCYKARREWMAKSKREGNIWWEKTCVRRIVLRYFCSIETGDGGVIVSYDEGRGRQNIWRVKLRMQFFFPAYYFLKTIPLKIVPIIHLVFAAFVHISTCNAEEYCGNRWIFEQWK